MCLCCVLMCKGWLNQRVQLRQKKVLIVRVLTHDPFMSLTCWTSSFPSWENIRSGNLAPDQQSNLFMSPLRGVPQTVVSSAWLSPLCVHICVCETTPLCSFLFCLRLIWAYPPHSNNSWVLTLGFLHSRQICFYHRQISYTFDVRCLILLDFSGQKGRPVYWLIDHRYSQHFICLCR